MEGDTRYYYITFDRKGKDGKRSYTIYTNLNSATSEQIPGSFLLSKEEITEILLAVLTIISLIRMMNGNIHTLFRG